MCESGFDARRNTFVQSYGSQHLDPSLLLIPQVGFLPPDDARMRGTVAAIERGLVVDGLVLRYSTDTDVDELPPGEREPNGKMSFLQRTDSDQDTAQSDKKDAAA